MRPVGFDEYLEFVRSRGEVVVEGNRIRLEPIEVRRLEPQEDELTDISTTVWSFPKRGSWATHKGDYRGNWPPQMARALILMYTKPGDTVLDPMVGSGTTCIEAKLLGRNCIAVDISYDAVMLTLHRLYYLEKALERGGGPEEARRARVVVFHGDARNLDKVPSGSVDLVATHPPYWSIIRYGRDGIGGELSGARSLEDYLRMLRDVARESFRVLKPGGHMGILIGDTRMRRHYVPITHYALQVLLDTGFILREEVIKIQHKMKTTREVWKRLPNRDFLLIYHEKLFILRKPADEKELTRYRYSSKPSFIELKL